MEGSQLLTFREAARSVGVSEYTVGDWVRKGDLPSYRLGYRTVRVKRDDLQSFLEARRNNGGAGR